LEAPELPWLEEAGVAPEVVEKVLSKTASKLVKEVEKLRKRIEEIRKAVELRKELFKIGFAEKFERLCYVAIDSSFTAPAIELVGGYLGIIVVVRELYGSRCTAVGEGAVDAKAFIELWFSKDYASSFAKYYERLTAKTLLEKKRSGEVHFDVLLLDGEIIPRTWREHGEKGIEAKLIEITNSIIELADKTDTAVVGVLKRSYSRDIVNILRFHDLKLSDRAVMSLILKPGEYLVVTGYDQLHRELELLKSSPGVDVEWLKARLKWYEGILENTPTGYSIKLAFYRAMKTLYPTATKVEYVTSSSIDEETLLSGLIYISSETGLPQPIDEVDRLATTALSKGLRYTVYQKLLAEVAKAGKEGIKEVQVLLSLMNPEKLGVVGAFPR
jgi:hypothetical protein